MEILSSTLLSEVKLFSIFQQSGNFRLKRREHWVRLKSHSNPSEPEILLKSHFSLILNSHRILSVLQVHRYSPSIFASLTFFKTLKSRLRSVRLWGIWWGRIRWRSPRLWSWWGSGLSRYKVCIIQICWYVWYKYICWSKNAMAILALKKQQTRLHNVWIGVRLFEPCKRPWPWKRIVLRPWTMTQ